MAANDIILNVSLDGAQEELNNLTLLQEAINSLAKQKKALNDEQKKLTKAVEDGTKSEEEATAAALDLAEQQVELNIITKQTKEEFRQAEKQVINNAKSNKVNEGSLAQMRLELSKNQKAYVNLSKEERENEEVGGKLQKQIKAQSDELKALEKDIGITSRSVGDYGKATESVLPLLGGFGQQIQAVIGNLGQIKEAVTKYSAAQKGMLASTKATNGGLKAFRIALISTGVGAIVVALGTLIAAFASTQRGVDALTSVLRPLQEIFQSIIGFTQELATSGFDRLKKAFEDPKQAAIDLGNAIKENLITRILAVPKLIKAAASSYINAFKLIGLGIKKVLADVPLIGKFIDKEQLKKDLEETKKAALDSLGELKDASIELSLGVDAESVKEAAGSVGEFFSEAAARGSELDRLQKEIEQNAIGLNREREKANRLFQEQKEIAQNTLLTDEERLKAAANAKNILAEVTKLEGDQLDRQIKLAKLKTEANDTDREAQTEIQDLIAEKERVEAAAISKRIELGNQANGIVKARIAANKKAAEDQAKLEEKQAQDKIKTESKAIDKKIEMLKLERQLELATIDETNEEKIQKEKDLLDTIGALRVEKAKLNGEDVATVELENKIAKAEKEKEVQDELDEQERVRLEDEATFKRQIVEQSKEVAVQAGKALVDAAKSRAEREKDIELANLDAKLQAGLITQEDFEKKKLEIEKAAFNKKKRLDLAIIAIDLAKELSAIAAAAAANPANAVTFGGAGISQAAALSTIAIARSGIQAAIVASQKFAQGGVIHGASHANGGVNVRVGGSGIIEAEGGEAIINKKSTSKHLGLLSAINQDGGGVPLAASGMVTPNMSTLARFGNGGVATAAAAQSQSIDLNDLENRIASAVGSIKVQNVASETTGVSNRVEQIQDSASF
jgi:hypothetical protein